MCALKYLDLKKSLHCGLYTPEEADLLPFAIKLEIICMNEELHVYYLKNVEMKKVPGNWSFISVTSFNSRFFKPFNKEVAAQNTARKQGKTVQAILDEWDFKNKRGKDVHALIERHIKYGEIPKVDDKYYPYFLGYLKFMKDNEGDFSEVESEVKFYSAYLRIAGTADLSVKSKRHGGTVHYDWKVVESLTLVSSEDPRYKVYCKSPFSKYEDCKLIKYSFQLQTYKFLSDHFYREKYGIVKGRYLVQLLPGNYKIYQGIELGKEIIKALRPYVYATDDMHEDQVILARMTPEIIWSQASPGIYQGRRWDSMCYVQVRSDVDVEVIFIGYPNNSKSIFNHKELAFKFAVEKLLLNK
jgi:hypothetical protein